MVLNDIRKNCAFETESPGCALEKYCHVSSWECTQNEGPACGSQARQQIRDLDATMVWHIAQRLARFCG